MGGADSNGGAGRWGGVAPTHSRVMDDRKESAGEGDATGGHKWQCSIHGTLDDRKSLRHKVLGLHIGIGEAKRRN